MILEKLSFEGKIIFIPIKFDLVLFDTWSLLTLQNRCWSEFAHSTWYLLDCCTLPGVQWCTVVYSVVQSVQTSEDDSTNSRGPLLSHTGAWEKPVNNTKYIFSLKVTLHSEASVDSE